MTKPMPFYMLSDAERRSRMLGTPLQAATTPQVVTNVYQPTAADLWRMRANGVVSPVEKIVELTDSNGTVKVALDENGKTVDAEKKPALTGAQMAMLAVGAFLLFGG